MEEPSAGPSRPRRPPAGNKDDLASRIVALQRKNAALGFAARPTDTRGSRRLAAESLSNGAELTTSPIPFIEEKTNPSPLAHGLPSRPPASPTAPRRMPQESQHRLKPAFDDEFSRGADRPSSQRALYDPSRPPVPQVLRTDRSPRPAEPEDRQRRRHDAGRRAEGSGQIPGPARKLFDPSIHDPHHFAPRSTPPSTQSESAGGSSRSLLRRTVNGRTPEEEADRERERRKRREGSERGSAPSRRKDSDTRSKGSRSSEGSESFKDRERGKGKSDTGVKSILKEIHDGIKKLEQELIDMHRLMSQDPQAGISILLERPGNAFSRRPRSAEDDTAAWVDLIAKHKQLAEMHDNFLVTLYDPLVPSSYHQLSVKYNIPSRLWQTGFHLILERLRHAWMAKQPGTLDLLIDVLNDSYRFYIELLENQALANFRTAWIEALGDLSRYHMTVASHVSEPPQSRREQNGPVVVDEGEGVPVSSGASIGAEVAQSWEVEDKETWRTSAMEWYTMGITEKPGEGRLHHHLALLCRDIKGQEGRALYHFVKSLTVTHEFATSRESILPLFDSALQSQRSLPDATAMDLFVRLHGMLFTRIQLDDFSTVMSRFMERLEEDASLDGVSRKATVTQVDWMIMASVNIAALLQYGASTGIIRKALAQEGAERRRQQAEAAAADEDGDGDGESGGQGDDHTLGVDFGQGSRATSPFPPFVTVDGPTDEPPPITLTHAIELAFAVFDFVLAHPNRIQGFHHVLNPYITIFLTFLGTLFRQQHVGAILAEHVPWYRLRDFVNDANIDLVEEKRLATGAPLPEDWIVRGSEWVGRRVYERGFWKGKSSSRGSSGMIAQPRIGERFQSEMDVLLANFDSALDVSEGVVDEVEGTDLTDGPVAVNQRRWKRVGWATGILAKHVDGFNLSDGKVCIEGPLAGMLCEVEETKCRERAEDERRKEAERKRAWAEDEVELLDQLETASDSGAEGDVELAALRERRKQLQSMLSGSAKTAKPKRPKRQSLQVIPGYTMLIFDTNVLLDSLTMFSKLVEGGQWSVVVPLPVVTELDGLSKEPAPLGANAKAAVTYLEARIHTHSLCLKIQTSKGNYLSDLLIRTEHHAVAATDSAGGLDAARTMDDRIINIACFQQEHFVDRSLLLGMPSAPVGSTKVLLVSNDRNLRLKARSRGVDCADEKELGGVIARAP